MPDNSSDAVEGILLALIAIFVPPLPVFIKRRCGGHFWLNILLWIFGWIPAVIHAWYIIFATPHRSRRQPNTVIYQPPPAASTHGASFSSRAPPHTYSSAHTPRREEYNPESYYGQPEVAPSPQPAVGTTGYPAEKQVQGGALPSYEQTGAASGPGAVTPGGAGVPGYYGAGGTSHEAQNPGHGNGRMGEGRI